MRQNFSISRIGQHGIIKDVADYDLPPNAISDGRNFRTLNGSIEPVVASRDVTSTVPFDPGFLMGVKTAEDFFILAAGRSAVKVFDGQSWFDISSVAGYASLGVDDELLWTSCIQGNIPIINNPSHFPEYWSPQVVAQVLQPLKFDSVNTWGMLDYSAKVIRSHGQYLFALNLREGSTYFPDSYRWSHPADINGLPFTWDETDLSAVAGKAAVGGNSGALVDGLTLRDAFILYSEFAVHALYPSGDEFVWKKVAVTTEYGLIAKGCIVEVNFRHYFISTNDICMTDGASVQSVLYGKLKSYYKSTTNFSLSSRFYALHHSDASEIWFCIVQGSAQYPNLAYVYNYVEETWALRDLPANTPHITYALNEVPSATWDASITTWDTVLTKWGYAPYANRVPLGMSLPASLVAVDDPENAEFLPITIVRTGLRVDTDDLGAQSMVDRVFTNFSGASTLSLQIGSQSYLGADVRWQPPESYDIAARRSIEQRSTGALHAYKLTGTPSNRFKFLGLSFSVNTSGDK